MARFAYIPLIFLLGCGHTEVITQYVDRPVEVRIPVPVEICPDSTFRAEVLQAISTHVDYRDRLMSPLPKGLASEVSTVGVTEADVIRATLLELSWRQHWLTIVADHYRRQR